MRVVVSPKQYKHLRAAIFVRYFDVSCKDVLHAQKKLECKDCSKHRNVVKVMTMWYKR